MIESISSYFYIYTDRILELGAQYGVDPMVFDFYYIGLAPVVWISAAIAIKNLRKGKPAIIPVSLTIITFLSPYLYVVYAGKNIPMWVYGLIVVLASFGIYRLWAKFTSKEAEVVSG